MHVKDSSCWWLKLTSAMTMLGMSTVGDTPSKTYFPENMLELDTLQQRRLFLKATREMVDKYVDLSFSKSKPSTKDHMYMLVNS